MTPMRFSLAPGARVGVFAPSHHFKPERLERGLEVLAGWGLTVVRGANLFERHRWFAGTDEQRAADLQWALSDPSLDAAWMVRGGSGLGRILDRVDWSRASRRPVVGFSDGTALHVALRQRAGLAGVHGPVITSLGDVNDEASLEAVRALLMGSAPARWEARPVRHGEAEGPLVGGNLTVLATLCGTADQLDARGCLLVLEDIGEFGYRLDRALCQLAQSGALDGVAGVVLGEFVECPFPGTSLEAIVCEYLEPGVPVIADAPVGHGTTNLAFPVGARARLHSGPEGAWLGWDVAGA
jgi:muramoyltetrapeptide carboxypeptidase